MNFNRPPKKETEKKILFRGNCTCKKAPTGDKGLDDMFHINEQYDYQLVKYGASYWYRVLFGGDSFARCDMATFDEYFDHLTADKEK